MAFEINKTELVWPGKYDAEGNPVQPPRVLLPFQVIERVNETRATREAKKAAGLTLFDVWDGKNEGSTFEDGWRNKLIWGENSLVASALLNSLAGRFDLIYIDPPFAAGTDFTVSVAVGDKPVAKAASAMEEVAYRDTWGNGMESYLSTMRVRLQLCRELLGAQGQLFLHCDYRAVAHLRLLGDEIFGSSNFRNEIVWTYSGGGVPKRDWPRKHDTILRWTMSDDWTFKVEYKPYKENTQAVGKHSTAAAAEGKSIDIDLERGTPVTDWWTDIPTVTGWNVEGTGYDTQKPEALLERIIKACTKQGDLVGDFFVGSGTTCVVAEKLGRRWVGCDLGRYAVHTTRKRLLDVSRCRPFELLNLGKYERQFWSSANFGDDLDGDGQVNLLEYIAFILKAYGAEPFAGSALLHGKKGDAYIHVGSVSSPVTIADIELAAEECKQLKGKKLHVLGWEWEMGLHDPVVSRAKRDLGIDLALRQIPNEVMEAEAVKKGQVKFFDLAYVEVEVEPKGKSGEFVCKLKDFSTPNTDLVPEEVRKQITKWSDYVDYWAVDWNFQNDTFNHDFVDFRTRQDRSLKLKSDPHTYEKPGTYQVLVKVIDIFGNDTSTIVELKVK
jgi:DNA modification methylase